MLFRSRLLPVAASAYGLQTGESQTISTLRDLTLAIFTCEVLAMIFVPQANEKYYDLGGAAGFLSTTFISLYYPSLKAKFWTRIPGATLPNISSFAPRQLLITACLSLWSLRLGGFLVSVRNTNSHRSKKDSCARSHVS